MNGYDFYFDHITGENREYFLSIFFLVGKDSSGEAVESATVFVFTILKDASHIGKSESAKLKSVFGAFPASVATKACHIIQNIILLLPEECLALIDKRNEKKLEEPLKEFGSDIKFAPFKSKVVSLDDALLSDSEDENVEIHMDFPVIKEEQIPSRSASSGGASNKDEINGSWLRNQCEHYFGDSSSGVSVLDLCSALFDILSSDRDNEAIQNELFDLLGFDRFEFIQTLLAKRHRIVIATSESASDLIEVKGELCTLLLTFATVSSTGLSLNFNSPVALIFTPVANLLLYG